MGLNYKVLLIVGAGILALLIITAYFLMPPQFYEELFQKCPASCDDGNSCTTESCSESTGYKCEIKSVPNCCGNNTCELSEKYETCAADCPLCDDNNQCSKDYFDYNNFELRNSFFSLKHVIISRVAALHKEEPRLLL